MPGRTPTDPGPNYEGESSWDRFADEIDTCQQLVDALEEVTPLIKAVQEILTVGNSKGEDLEALHSETLALARSLVTSFTDGEPQ